MLSAFAFDIILQKVCGTCCCKFWICIRPVCISRLVRSSVAVNKLNPNEAAGKKH